MKKNKVNISLIPGHNTQTIKDIIVKIFGDNFNVIEFPEFTNDYTKMLTDVSRTILDNSVEFVIHLSGKYEINDDDHVECMNAIFLNDILPRHILSISDSCKLIKIDTPISAFSKRSKVAEHSHILSNIISDRVWKIRTKYLKYEYNPNINKKPLIPFLKSLKKGSVINGFIDHLWNGITDLALVRIIGSIIMNFESIKPGEYAISSGKRVNRYQLVNYISWEYNLDIGIERMPSLDVVDESVYPSNIDDVRNIWKLAGYQDIPNIEYLIKERNSTLG